jgi:hypothetical protein
MNAMKFIVCLSLAVLGDAPLWAESTMPKGYDVSRYEMLWKRSPFTLSSAGDETTFGFAQDMILGGIAKIGNTEMITIVDKKTQRRLLISPTAQPDGISLVSIQMDNDLKKTSATIRKGGETATIKYDMEYLAASAPAPVASAPAPGMQPGQGNNSNNLPRVQNPNRGGANRGGPPRVIPRRIVIPNAPPTPPAQ